MASEKLSINVIVPSAVCAASDDVRTAYIDALRREVRSAADDESGAEIVRVSLVGCTAATVTLAGWVGLIDDLETSFPGTREARMRIDVSPELLDTKTCAYASRYRLVINLLIDSVLSSCRCADGALDVDDTLARAISLMTREHISNWGVQLCADHVTASDATDARVTESECVEAIMRETRPGYVRFADVDTPDAGACPPDNLSRAFDETGYAPCGGGLYARKPLYAAFFSHEPNVMGFGLGARTSFRGARFTTTDDLDLYLNHAGTSADIYRLDS